MTSFDDLVKDVVATTVKEVAGPVIAAALAACLPEIVRRAALPVYLDKAALMELTGWSSRKIDYMRARRQIPFVRRGRTVLFVTADVEAYLREGYVPAKGDDANGG